jgi:anti-sigma factor RsiW
MSIAMEQCQYITWIGAMLDGELDEQRRLELEAHLKTCANCQSELESLRLLSQTVRGGIVPPAISSDAMKHLHARVDDFGDRSLRHLAEALSGVAAAILIGCSFWLFKAPTVQASEQLPPWYSLTSIRPQQAQVPQSMQTAEWIFSELSTDAQKHD